MDINYILIFTYFSHVRYLNISFYQKEIQIHLYNYYRIVKNQNKTAPLHKLIQLARRKSRHNFLIFYLPVY